MNEYKYYDIGSDKLDRFCRYARWVFLFIAWQLWRSGQFGYAMIALTCGGLCILFPIVILPVSPKTVLRISTSDYTVQLLEKNEPLISIPYEQLSIAKHKRFQRVIIVFGKIPIDGMGIMKLYHEISLHNVFCFPYDSKMKQDFPAIFKDV